MHVCIHPCMHAYMHTSMHACMHTSMHACIHHACMHAYMHTYIFFKENHIYIYIYKNILTTICSFVLYPRNSWETDIVCTKLTGITSSSGLPIPHQAGATLRRRWKPWEVDRQNRGTKHVVNWWFWMKIVLNGVFNGYEWLIMVNNGDWWWLLAINGWLMWIKQCHKPPMTSWEW